MANMYYFQITTNSATKKPDLKGLLFIIIFLSCSFIQFYSRH